MPQQAATCYMLWLYNKSADFWLCDWMSVLNTVKGAVINKMEVECSSKIYKTTRCHSLEERGRLQTPAALPPEMNALTHWIGGRMFHTCGLDGFAKEKNILPRWDSKPGPSSP
jgi:hypothetical protein